VRPFHGHPVDLLTQRWVQVTGRRLLLAEHPWLDGPIGDPERIGHDFFETLAAAGAVRFAERGAAAQGLMPSFSALRSSEFDPDAVAPEIGRFYERTSEYRLEISSQWSARFVPFGHALAAVFSRRLQQLNVPLPGPSSKAVMASSIAVVEDPRTGESRYTAWVRRTRGSGETIYVAAYSVTALPGHAARFVKVVFPLPNGYAMVVLRPAALADGSLLLVSRGSGFGDPGFYFLVRGPHGRAWVRYVRTFHETIRVFVGPGGELLTDHDFHIWRRRFLRLRYGMRPSYSSASQM
jgi:hypothetical protein